MMIGRGPSRTEDRLATFTTHDEERIVFETTGDERAFGLLLLGHGALFAGAPLYGLASHGVPEIKAFLLLSVILLVGLAEVAYSLYLLCRTEWLIIDLRHRSYRGRRGILLWGERLAGPLGDFEGIRLRAIPCGRRSRHLRWVVEWEWSDGRRRPFRVSDWGRLRSFHLAAVPSRSGSLVFLRSLVAIAADAGLPLAIPRSCLDGIGVGDLQLDVSSTSSLMWPDS
jgi:hypothetical protein